MNKAKKYRKAGVDITAGDSASRLAAKLAATTFAGRGERIGKPVRLPGGFAGALDFGKFYLTQCDDGTGTKMAVAECVGRYDTLGADLAAMVLDDAVCLGAEVISLSNTLDVPKVNQKHIEGLLRGLVKACREQGVVIPGGEIAEVGRTVSGYVWNATAIGIVSKNRIIDGSKIKSGDIVIALREKGLRSNGFSLARHILTKKFGKNWYCKPYDSAKWRKQSRQPKPKTWGELLLTPSKIYHAAILSLTGRYGEKRKVDIHGVVHVTGGGIPGNLPRILKNTPLNKRGRKRGGQESRSPKADGGVLGATLPKLWQPAGWIQELIRLGKVSEAEAREVWNLGNGMLVIVAPKDADQTLKLLRKAKVQAKIAGEINTSGKIIF